MMQQRDSTQKAYEEAVTIAMKQLYGISWQDACGDLEPLARAQADGWTPEQFVKWFGERYDLQPLHGHVVAAIAV